MAETPPDQAGEVETGGVTLDYRQLMWECLQHPGSDHQEGVLKKCDARQAEIMRRLLERYPERVATSVYHAGHGMGNHQRLEVRRRRLAEVEPKWLRDEVERLVRLWFKNR